MARLRGLMRRSGAQRAATTSVLVVGDLELDEDSHEVTRAGEQISLTATEFELLRFLMRNPKRVLSKAQILDRVWNYDFGGQANVVELYISYLRKKIDAGREPMIHTMRGAGYVLKPAGESMSHVFASLTARLVLTAVALVVAGVRPDRRRRDAATQAQLTDQLDDDCSPPRQSGRSRPRGPGGGPPRRADVIDTLGVSSDRPGVTATPPAAGPARRARRRRTTSSDQALDSLADVPVDRRSTPSTCRGSAATASIAVDAGPATAPMVTGAADRRRRRRRAVADRLGGAADRAAAHARRRRRTALVRRQLRPLSEVAATAHGSPSCRWPRATSTSPSGCPSTSPTSAPRSARWAPRSTPCWATWRPRSRRGTAASSRSASSWPTRPRAAHPVVHHPRVRRNGPPRPDDDARTALRQGRGGVRVDDRPGRGHAAARPARLGSPARSASRWT